MSAQTDFFDTNIILYLLGKDEAKADRALALLGSGGTISVQVLNEAASVARRKLGCDWQQLAELLGTVRGLCAVCPLRPWS